MATECDDVGRCAAARCKPRRDRLDGPPHFGQTQPEFIVQAHSDSPCEYVRVKVIPVTGIEYARADTGFRSHETLRGQRRHDFAQHRTRDLESFYEFGLGRHVPARWMDALQYLRSQD